jgi:hypothetical protein
MLGKALHRQKIEMAAEDAAAPGGVPRSEEGMSLQKVRAVAIGAALAASVDMSPVVLVSIQANAQRDRGGPRRRTP